MRADCEGYVDGIVMNIIDSLPLMTIYFQIILALIFDEKDDDKLLGAAMPFINTVGILFLWFKCIYYLRIWESTNYLAGMVVKVVTGMRWFLMVYMMSHMAFGQGFYRLSIINPQYAFTDRAEDFTFLSSVFYSFLLSIGEFAYPAWNHPPSEHKNYNSTSDNVFNISTNCTPTPMIYRSGNANFNLTWILYLISVTFNNIVMLNLLIAIITDTYNEVRDVKFQVAFQERASAISNYQRILPKRWTRYQPDDIEFLTCTKLLLVAEEQEESDAIDRHLVEAPEESIIRKLDVCSDAIKVMK